MIRYKSDSVKDEILDLLAEATAHVRVSMIWS